MLGIGQDDPGRVRWRARWAPPTSSSTRIFHQPGWTPLDDEHVPGPGDGGDRGGRWVVDGNYSTVRDIVWDRADTVVWFDLPYVTVMARTIRRTVRRTVTREELWNGNREPLVQSLVVQPREVDHRLDGHPARGLPSALRGRRARPALGRAALRPPALPAGGGRVPGRRDVRRDEGGRDDGSRAGRQGRPHHRGHRRARAGAGHPARRPRARPSPSAAGTRSGCAPPQATLQAVGRRRAGAAGRRVARPGTSRRSSTPPWPAGAASTASCTTPGAPRPAPSRRSTTPPGSPTSSSS